MHFLWLSFSLLLLQDPTPYKPKEEFDIKLAFQFKQRPANGSYKVDFSETRREQERRTQGGPLPYLFLNVNILQLNPEEVRVKVINNLATAVMNRKFKKDDKIELDLGFTDDIKDRVSSHHYTILFLSQTKSPLSKIDIFFEEDGTYLVNGEKRGKL